MRRCALLSTFCFLLSCTTVPRPVWDEGASYDGGQRDSGFRGWHTNETGQVFAVMSPLARVRYNVLITRYGTNFLAPLTVDAGVTPFTNGTALLDAEHDVKFRQMNLWKKNGLKP